MIAAWWEAPASRRTAYGIAALLGACVFLAVYGPGHLFGTSAYWDLPQQDSRAYLMGYRYFLHEPWHWPIFTSYTINVPDPKGFALSDGIPVWALLNKTLATILPPWGTFSERAYLGTWQLVCHVLQAGFAVAIVRQLGRRTHGAAVMAALMFLALPAWSFRYQHAALSAHFLLLWPIYLYLRTPAREVPPRRVQLGWIAELFVASLTNPYHAVMSFGIFVAACIRARRLPVLAWAVGALAVIAVGAWFTGYLTRGATVKMGGFEIYSTNMMSMFVPPNSGIFGDARGWFGDEIPIHNQYEGLTYLGLGAIVLVVLALVRPREVKATVARHPALFTVALGAWLFALSTHVYFNSHLVLAWQLPRPLQFIATWFRAPGRFAYVPAYVLLVYAVARGLAVFSSGKKRWIMPAVVLLQLVDATGQWKVQHAYTRAAYEHGLPIAPWRTLVLAHDRVLELPTFDCLSDDWTKLEPALEIAYYASERALPINGVYGARPVRDCTADERRFPDHAEPGTLYVWFTKSDRHARQFAASGAACGRFSLGWACSTDAVTIDAAVTAGALTRDLATAPPAPVLALGDAIHPGIGGTPQYLTDGWSYPEDGGRWTEGPVATLRFRLAGEPPARAAIELHAVTVVCGRRWNNDVAVTVNDVPVGSLHFDNHANDLAATRTIELDGALLRGPEVLLDLKPSDVRPPSTVRCNDDARRTGILIRDLTVVAR